jgi:uncharacterized repeat protein (TIGR02543 family)
VIKKIKYILFAILSAALLLFVFKAGSLFAAPQRVWIGNTELTSGQLLAAGGGTAKYDREKKILTLTDAVLEDTVYAEGNLNIELRGKNYVGTAGCGVRCLGDLYVFGDGSLEIKGEDAGIITTGCLSISERADVRIMGKKPLRIYGSIHTSPLYTIEYKEEMTGFYPPYTVKLDYGYGEPEYLQYKLGDRVERPLDPERSGYWFDNWYENEELTIPFDFNTARSEDVTIYAGWIKIVYVVFDSWGGSEVPEAEIAWGDRVKEPPPPVREGYIFDGWYGDSKLTERFDFSLPLFDNTPIYAKWTKLAEAVYYGIDVARYQLDIDWEAVKASGVGFAIIRAGFRGYGSEGTLNTDENFAANITGARQAGLDAGVYFFSQATNIAEAVEEAEYLLELIKDYDVNLPVFMDYEIASDIDGKLLGRLYEADLTGEQHAEICLAFCDTIEKAGYTAMVYAGMDMLSDALGEALEDAGYGVWLANWGVQTRYNGDYSFWQYSGAGNAEGIGVDVDLDVRYITPPGNVTGLKAETVKNEAGESGVKLAWDRMPGVSGYMIYRYDTKAGGYIEYARTRGSASVEYTDTNPTEDSRYMVCAYIQQSGIDYRGGLSDAVSLPMK